MLTSQQITERLYDKFRSLVPETPEAVLQVYQSAVDYYGEENVDLQYACVPKVFKDWLSNVQLAEVFNKFDIYMPTFEADFSQYWSACAMDVFVSHPDKFNRFLEILTPDMVISARLTRAYGILVRFRNFRVVNENEVSTDIEEMFALTHVDFSGRLCDRMRWCRTRASGIHYLCGYRHSHLPTKSMESYTLWGQPCLGTGPICMTIHTLEEDYNPDLWPLYWHELNSCIKVESLEGGPYIKITEISHRSMVYSTEANYTSEICRFSNAKLPFKDTLIREVINSGLLKWRWNKNHIEISNPFTEFNLIVSNCYLDILIGYQLGEEATEEDAMGIILEEVFRHRMYFGRFTASEKIESLKQESVSTQEVSRTLDWSFKGEPVVFHADSLVANVEKFCLLNLKHVSLIYHTLTLLANNSYERNRNTRK